MREINNISESETVVWGFLKINCTHGTKLFIFRTEFVNKYIYIYNIPVVKYSTMNYAVASLMIALHIMDKAFPSTEIAVDGIRQDRFPDTLETDL
jgi:hypothetical protein